jgi:hypothetical protein
MPDGLTIMVKQKVFINKIGQVEVFYHQEEREAHRAVG